MNNITWKHKDYGNESLNKIARNITEFHTGNLEDVKYSKWRGTPIGTVFLHEPFTVKDTGVLNSLMNYNVFFKHNTEDDIVTNFVPDCAVVLASGDRVTTINSKYTHVIDISPRALEKTKEIFDLPESMFYQLDVFNISDVKEFLKTCKGKTGLFCLSNIFLYLPSCVMYDVHFRLKKQNELIKLLAQDKIDWVVDMVTVNGTYIQTPAKYLLNTKLDKKFEVLPWIK